MKVTVFDNLSKLASQKTIDLNLRFILELRSGLGLEIEVKK